MSHMGLGRDRLQETADPAEGQWRASQSHEEVRTILEPFEQVTVEISAERYVTASKAILLAKGLQRVTANYHRSATTEQASGLVNSLCETWQYKMAEENCAASLGQELPT
ncbi:hypothetical protein AAFF_G00392250 [Aldrovandia affinis]|uniref:Uncharacterized protein n=1 Tax=Aldrovandia affinis TaxID=143900 RepID=A0AAD7WL03_9TELE|nr:hypothetical protein AAFF_G00392250 [Aldrovandia affinis]